jgi:tRNA(adenine34) deaminase
MMMKMISSNIKCMMRIISIILIQFLLISTQNQNLLLSSSFALYSIPSLRQLYRKQIRRPSPINFPTSKEQKPSNQTFIFDFSDYIGHKDNYQNDTETYIHHSLMDLALDQAREAGKVGEVPIGAIVVQEVLHDINGSSSSSKDGDNNNTKDSQQKRKFVLLSSGQNQIETIHDASAHAELQALRSASHNLQNWRLINTTLYTTLEPCPMCLSAAQAFRVSKIVYGAPDLRLGAIETHIQLLDVVTHPFHDTMEVVGGVKREECGKLLVSFFRERRKQKKNQKKKEIHSEGDIDDAKNSKNNNDADDILENRSSIRRLLHRVKSRFR